jgi:hypothetical protein
MVYRDMKSLTFFATLPDGELLETTNRLAGAERHATAELIAARSRADRRRPPAETRRTRDDQKAAAARAGLLAGEGVAAEC